MGTATPATSRPTQRLDTEPPERAPVVLALVAFTLDGRRLYGRFMTWFTITLNYLVLFCRKGEGAAGDREGALR
jgi:hypothetical protein